MNIEDVIQFRKYHIENRLRHRTLNIEWNTVQNMEHNILQSALGVWGEPPPAGPQPDHQSGMDH